VAVRRARLGWQFPICEVELRPASTAVKVVDGREMIAHQWKAYVGLRRTATGLGIGPWVRLPSVSASRPRTRRLR
jgi:hypothetical protein